MKGRSLLEVAPRFLYARLLRAKKRGNPFLFLRPGAREFVVSPRGARGEGEEVERRKDGARNGSGSSFSSPGFSATAFTNREVGPFEKPRLEPSV